MPQTAGVAGHMKALNTRVAVSNPTMFYTEEFYTQAPNPGPRGRNFILTSLSGSDILSCFQMFFLAKKLLSN